MSKRRIIEILGIVVLGFSVPALFGFADYSMFEPEYWVNSGLISFIFTVVYWGGNILIFDFLRAKFPAVKDNTKRLVFEFVLVTIFSTWFSIYGCEPIVAGIFGKAPGDKIFFLKIGLGLSYFVVAIYEGVFFFYRWKDSLLEAEELKREKLVSQFEALKQQVSPHFLFNSLNTLINLIPQDQAKAVKFTQHLSYVYRYVLMNKDLDTVSLRSELKFVDSYFYLNRIRFGNNVKLEIEIDEKEMSKLVAPLSLQILIENAIKHNIITEDQPLKIEIFMDGNSIVVRNNLQVKKNTTGTRIGLQNIINRYKLLETDGVVINDSDGWFSVSLPSLSAVRV